jgi:uncharacterized protein YdhG (YjbR/CyaY superfamily)
MNVDDYLTSVPEDARDALRELRDQIRSAAPAAREVMSYGIPLYCQHGHLVGFGGFRGHCSFFVTSSAALDAFSDELADCDSAVARTTIRFTPDKPLPAELVRRIVQFRIEENRESVGADRAPRV